MAAIEAAASLPFVGRGDGASAVEAISATRAPAVPASARAFGVRCRCSGRGFCRAIPVAIPADGLGRPFRWSVWIGASGERVWRLHSAGQVRSPRRPARVDPSARAGAPAVRMRVRHRRGVVVGPGRRRRTRRSSLPSDRADAAGEANADAATRFGPAKKFAHFRANGLVRREIRHPRAKEFFVPVQAPGHAFGKPPALRPRALARMRRHRTREKNRIRKGVFQIRSRTHDALPRGCVARATARARAAARSSAAAGREKNRRGC